MGRARYDAVAHQRECDRLGIPSHTFKMPPLTTPAHAFERRKQAAKKFTPAEKRAELINAGWMRLGSRTWRHFGLYGTDKFFSLAAAWAEAKCWRCEGLPRGWNVTSPMCSVCAEEVGMCLRCGQSKYDPAKCRCEAADERTTMNTVLHKDENNNFAIVTTAESEEEFRGQFAAALSEMVDSKTYDGDWPFHLNGWIEQATEITCKFRGYKSAVVERRTIIAGILDPDAAVLTVGRQEAVSA